MLKLWLITTLMFLSSCSMGDSDGEQIEKVATSFSDAYFNYDFKQAERYLTSDSKKWIAYAASNIHDADVQVLRNQLDDASVQIDDIQQNDDDSTASVSVIVNNYMRIDTIGNAGRMIAEAKFHLLLVHSGSSWKVRMVGLPRSEK
jgi:hypothetical protein